MEETMPSVSKRSKTSATACTIPKISVRNNFPALSEVTNDSSSSIYPVAVADAKSDSGGKFPGPTEVEEVLLLYRDVFQEMKREEKLKGSRTNFTVHQRALKRLSEMQKCLNVEKRFGEIPGVSIGDSFLCRGELAAIGLHGHIQRGIDFLKENKKLFAVSIVDSRFYENQRKSSEVLIYSGEGGIPTRNNQESKDQVLEGGNLALYNSIGRKNPVRVIRKSSISSVDSVFIYDGLYLVVGMKEERGKEHGKLIFQFKLERIGGQTRANRGPGLKMTKTRIVSDISRGKEEVKVPLVNEFDGEKPAEFEYITSVNHEGLQFECLPDCCGCTSQCSNSENCLCKQKNGGEIPYDNRGNLVRKSPLIFECGSSCKCPDSCFNRVTQLGRKKELEVFKTKDKGWGVRSRSHIGPNTFICEIVGEIIEEMEIEPGEIIEESNLARLVDNEYLFKLQNETENSSSHKNDGAFLIDASVKGNVARFINHSCNANLYVQRVLYDHGDSRKPHIMLFSKQHIPANQELTFNYNNSSGLKSKGRAKNCKCKASECVGWF